MKPRFCVILMLLTFGLLVFVPNSFAQETSPEHVVRVVYFVPKDRQSQQDIDTKLDLLMKDAQQSYTEVMENHGFGRKTFPLETDKDGKVIVHHVTGSFPDVYYHTESFNKVEKEIRQWFDPTTNVYFTVLDVSTEYIDGAYCGQGADRRSYGGMSLMPASGVCFTVAIAARQLGYTFGIRHDRLRDPNRVLSSYHSDLMVTSFCAAEWLNVHPYFNAGENVSNANTQIQMLSSVVSPSNSIRIRFQIDDADGLHQAQVELNGNIIACQKLKGQSNTYEFEWIPTLYGISDNLTLRVIDVHGNFTNRNYPLDIAALPPPEVVSIPDTNLATAIRETLNLVPGEAFTEWNLLKLTDLTARNRQITDLTGLEHATQLTVLNIADNKISEITPLTDLTLLSYIDLSTNRIRDITPLARLTQLRTLWFLYNNISDISPLAELSDLTHLHLRGNVISDVSPLAGLINLEYLEIDDNLISDISPLDGLAEKTYISWNHNPGFPIGGPKITGPWLWVTVPETHLDNSTDFLARVSGGETTELEIATNGVKERRAVGDRVWTPHKLSNSGSDNINEMITALGWGTGEDVYTHILYGCVALDVPRQQNTQMFVGSDDAVKVWLNGELVHQALVRRGAGDYQEFFPVTLKEGKNILLVALDNSGGWLYSGFFGFAPDAEYTVLPPDKDDASQLNADVNGDGTVNISDLVIVASNLGETGENDADVNGDGIVDIRDLVQVAGVFGTSAAAPSLDSQALSMFTATDVQKWISQAQSLDLTNITRQRGIRFLEELLAALIPKETALLPNYPNPFNPETWIPYQLAKTADVTLTIYAVNGQIVRQLALGYQAAGIYHNRSRAAYWDGRNAVGEPVASGIYFYTLTADNFTATRKMLIAK